MKTEKIVCASKKGLRLTQVEISVIASGTVIDRRERDRILFVICTD